MLSENNITTNPRDLAKYTTVLIRLTLGNIFKLRVKDEGYAQK